MECVPDDSDAVDLTVGQAAARLGVTVRTLHHWDEIALAQPSSRSAAGYRLYTEGDLERLRRIVVYREAGARPGSHSERPRRSECGCCHRAARPAGPACGADRASQRAGR
ncbi:MerR family transcriptional regulator [Curtobacterium flaccumfaciens]|nr:MerR family transcriptional regulator [Curtobacterium flaccumfaciens]